MNIQIKTERPGSSGLRGRVALVTGSTSGIGLGIAEALADQGCIVVLNGFGGEAAILAALDALRQRSGAEARHCAADASDGSAVTKMCRSVIAEFGRLDILVNNAGIQHVAPVESFPPEKWDAILALNLSSAFHTIRAVLPSMRQHGFGRIINIASAHGLVASPFKSAYVAAKHGLIGLTRTVALECAEADITCNAICPGYVYTPLVESQIEAQARAHGIDREAVIRDVLLAQQPNRRFAAVEEIGALAVFLAGPGAASITGAALPVDGGWTAH
jgi:3-hydroxybutyrate dehydrogenase